MLFTHMYMLVLCIVSLSLSFSQHNIIKIIYFILIYLKDNNGSLGCLYLEDRIPLVLCRDDNNVFFHLFLYGREVIGGGNMFITLCCLTTLYINIKHKYNFQSTSIAYTAYECKWYELSATDARNLMFLVYRSRIPLRLTAGKFGIFSMEMFGAVRCLREEMYHSLHAVLLRKYFFNLI